MIEVQDLCKSFQNFQALDHTNMCIKTGSIYGLVGPNGAGKSTLIRHLTGIYQADSGSVLFDGQPVFENPSVKQSIAYIPDDLFFFSQSNTKDMMQFYKGIYPDFDTALFHKLTEYFPNIDIKKPIQRLSKGMQKQAYFMLALSCRARYLILDEPIDGLDPVIRRQIWSMIMGDVEEHKTTVLVSSHNLRELEDICDHVGLSLIHI